MGALIVPITLRIRYNPLQQHSSYFRKKIVQWANILDKIQIFLSPWLLLVISLKYWLRKHLDTNNELRWRIHYSPLIYPLKSHCYINYSFVRLNFTTNNSTTGSRSELAGLAMAPFGPTYTQRRIINATGPHSDSRIVARLSMTSELGPLSR